MRKVAANYVFPVSSAPIRNGIVTFNDEGIITEIKDNGGALMEAQGIEFYNGILVPGFVNCHCHLELSHLHKKISHGNGLMTFINELVSIRNVDIRDIKHCISVADSQMYSEGIVAVGDISNTSDSITAKMASKIKYHTFIELFDLYFKDVGELIANGALLQKQYEELGLSSSIVPHAPYSVSPELFVNIASFHKKGLLYSIHNQETTDEDLMFLEGKGVLFDMINKMPNSRFLPTGKASLPSYFDYLPNESKVLLVHNTFSRAEHIQLLKNKDITLVLCPNANRYIENRLPDIPMFVKEGIKLALGTDSLASNYKLSILEEMKTIVASFPDISFEEVLQWGTLNGAKALGLEADFGSFEVGKKPGINLICNFDFQKMTIDKDSFIKKLV
ncbi:MAG TPA: amidohydrolase family protein [Bacteroidales bacterium]